VTPSTAHTLQDQNDLSKEHNLLHELEELLSESEKLLNETLQEQEKFLELKNAIGQTKQIKSIMKPTYSTSTQENMQNKPEPTIKITRLSNKAKLPTKRHHLSVGYDLYSAYEYIIPAFGKNIIHTDLQISVPYGTYGRIAPQSSLSWYKHLDIGAGVIDYNFEGNVMIIMFNHGNRDQRIKPGDKVAQLICEQILYPELEDITTTTST